MLDIISQYIPEIIAGIPGILALGIVWFVDYAKNDGKDDWKDDVIQVLSQTIAKVEEKQESKE